MEQNNFDYLKKQVKYTGFGDALEFQIKDNMEKGQSFQLQHAAEFGKDKLDATLNFKLSEKGMYFFNSYEVALHKDGADPKIEPLKQTFYINAPESALIPNPDGNKGGEQKEWVNSNITLREGYNLMDGRSVQKDFVTKDQEKFTSWVTIDFMDTDKYGNYQMKKKTAFDLEGKLAEYPIKELANVEAKRQLIESLQKGNRQSVTFVHNGQEEKRFIEANPQYKGIKVYDGEVRITQKQNEQKGQEQKEGKQNSQKKENKNKVSNRKNKSQGVS